MAVSSRTTAAHARPLAVGAALAAALVLLAAACLQRAGSLQARLDSAPALRHIEEQLRGPLARDELAALRARMRELYDRAELGLHYLEVADAAGIVLAAFGRHEAWNPPLLPEAAARRLRLARYRLGTQSGRVRMQDGGRAVGSFDYAIDTETQRQVHDAAVRELRIAGTLGLSLGLPLTLILLWRLRASPAAPLAEVRADAALSRRLQPPRAGVLSTTPAADTAQDAARLRERAGELLDPLNLALLVTDRDGVVRHLNASAEQLSGWTRAAALGQQVYSVLRTLDESGAVQPSAAERCLQTGGAVPRAPGRLRSRGGAECAIDSMALPLRDADGVVTGAAMLFSDASAREQETDELRRAARLSQAVIDHLDEGLITTDRAGVVRTVNARALAMFGYSREELDGFSVGKLMPVPFLNTPNVKLSDYIGPADAARALPRVIGWRRDATTFPLELEVQPLSLGDDSGLILIARDVSERQRGQNLAQRLGRLLDAALEEIYIFDAQTLEFLEVNRGARRNLGVAEAQLLGMTLLDISAGLDAETFHGHLAALRSGGREQVTYQCRHRRADGSDYAVEVRLSYSRDEEPPVFMAIASDIGDRVVAEDRLKKLAHQDALTGLPNRRVLQERLRDAQREAAQRGSLAALLFLDMDRFKLINDTLGHEAGDAVLRESAKRLLTAVHSSDLVVRLGGDEFAVLAPELHAASDAERIAQKIFMAFAAPIDIGGLPQFVTPSIGIAVYPQHGLGVEDLLRNADAAMYQAKHAGRACYRVYAGPPVASA